MLGKHCLFIKFYLLQSIHWANQEALEKRRRFSQVLLSELPNPPHRSDAEFLSKPGKMQTQWDPAEPESSILPPAHPQPYRGVPIITLPPLLGTGKCQPRQCPRPVCQWKV